ncbi:hypothetical protein GCM10018775_46440 [Streptomyces umbrinus]|nr:hypothetical protein GCM10018775_46440 [Streptomyces umbrinus]
MISGAGRLWLDCAVPRAPKNLGARGTAQSFGGGSGAEPLSQGREWVGAAGAKNQVGRGPLSRERQLEPGIHSITFDCTGDPYDLGLFWSALLGRPLADDDKPGDPEALIEDPAGGPRLLFVRVPEGKTAKNRIHFDLKPKGRTREEEVDRAIALGARVTNDLRRPDGGGWVTMEDPEGNEFCVERGELG